MSLYYTPFFGNVKSIEVKYEGIVRKNNGVATKMGLKFAPLGFIFHDGWNWRQSKTLMSYDQNGNPKPMDDSKKCYQRGHIHLFLPTVEYAPSGSSLAYGRQQR